MKTISIAIPTYEMHGMGCAYLKQNLDILAGQTFKDFDVIISDHSVNNDIQNLCASYMQMLDISYYRNDTHRGNSSANCNNAIKNAKGSIIKILFQDDFLFHEQALGDIVRAFDTSKSWLITACTHTKDGVHFFRPFYPKYNNSIYLGKNTISSPSVLAIRNDHPLLFDESLIWLMDCDYYRRCHDTFGDPIILNSITIANRIGAHQVSSTLATEALRYKEYVSVVKKYDTGIRRAWLICIGALRYGIHRLLQ